MPVVHKFSPETAHRIAVLANKYQILPRSHYEDPDILVMIFSVNNVIEIKSVVSL